MRSLDQSSSSSNSAMDQGKEPAIQSNWHEQIQEIVATLMQAAATANLGENPGSGLADVTQQLNQALSEKTIRGVIVQLKLIQTAILARINAWHRITGSAESREAFARLIGEKIIFLESIAQQMSNTEESNAEAETLKHRLEEERIAKEKLEKELQRLKKESEHFIQNPDEIQLAEMEEEKRKFLQTQMDLEEREKKLTSEQRILEEQKQQLESDSKKKADELAVEKQTLLQTKTELEEKQQKLISEKNDLEGTIREQKVTLSFKDKALEERAEKIKKQKEKRKDVERQLQCANVTAQEVRQKIIQLESELKQLKENNDILSRKIENAQQEMDTAKSNANDLKKEVENLTAEKQKAEKKIEEIKGQLENKEGDSKDLAKKLEGLEKTKSELEDKLTKERESAQMAEEKVMASESALKSLTQAKDSLALEKTELEKQKNLLEEQKKETDERLLQKEKEMSEKLVQKEEEKRQLEERNKVLEKDAAELNQLKRLALTYMDQQPTEGALVQLDLANIFRLLLERSAAPQRETSRASFEIQNAIPYAEYTTVKDNDGKSKNLYENEAMQSMLAYRKPTPVFNVIKKLLTMLNKLNADMNSAKTSYSSSSFMAPENAKIKIHNMQVFLCYFLLYNAPMRFLVNHAVNFSKENQQFVLKDWTILQIIEEEIPGLKEVEHVLQKEMGDRREHDSYEFYNDFITFKEKQLTTQKDRDGKLLIKKYTEKFHTFKWHQLVGLLKLFESQSMDKIFGNLSLIPSFKNEIKAKLKNYQKNPSEPTMDVKKQDNGELTWAGENTSPQVSMKK